MAARGTAPSEHIDLRRRGVDVGQTRADWFRCEPCMTSRIDLHQSCAAPVAYSAISEGGGSSVERDLRCGRRLSLSCPRSASGDRNGTRAAK